MRRRLVDNPPNPFESAYREWLGEPPPARLEVYEETAKSALVENDSPDISFRWSLNPYRGCQHACAYCYARRTHEYLGYGAGTDFDTRITVKQNLPELLDKEFGRRSWRRESVVFSGVTDCYQPLEAVYKITRRCLEVCRDHANPVGIVTKGFLIVRDIDLLVEINCRARARVFMSIAFADDGVSRLMEPGAPPPSRRFEALRRLHEAEIPVGIMVAPIIPGLNDRDLAMILARAAECGAQTAGYGPLRLPGSVQDVFLARLRAQFPDHAERVEHHVRELHGGRLNDPRFGMRMRGQGVYWQGIQQLFETTARRLKLDRHEERGALSGAPASEQEKPITPADVAPGRFHQLPLFGAHG